MSARKKKAVALKRPVIECLESAANALRGINMHLGIIEARGEPDLAQPISSIAAIIEDIDAAVAVLLPSDDKGPK